jgi:hypothetical protein
MSSETYRKEINERKAKAFFRSVLKDEGRPYLNSDTAIEILSEILTNKLLEKLEREKRR